MMTEKLFEMGILAIALSSLSILFVLMIRTAVARWLGARWAYLLWLVPLLGLLAIAFPSQSVQRALNVPAIEVPVVKSVVVKAGDMFNLAGDSGQVGNTQASTNQHFDTVNLVLGFWLLSALLLLLIFSVRSVRSSQSMYRLSTALCTEQQAIVRARCAPLTDHFSIPVRMMSSNHGPAVVGLLRQVLYLPGDFFQRFSSRQQVLILEHEVQHLMRHDLIALLLARIYRCIFWFNPLAYIAESYLRLDQELSVDEAVLASRDGSTRRLYGETLVLSAHAGAGFAQVGYSPTFGQIRQRTQMLRYYHVRTARKMLGGLLLAVSVSVSIVFGTLGVLEFRPDAAVQEARALGGKATVQFSQKNYVAALRSMQQMERISPASMTAENLALHSRVLLKLNQWDQGLRYINRAISQSESDGQIPNQDWLLMQTALEWKLGDSPAAAISLRRSIQLYPETTYEDTLVVLNELVQDVWVPIAGSDSLAQL